MRYRSIAVAGTVLSVAALTLTACKSSGTTTSTNPPAGSAGGGGKTLVISTDLPLQGSAADTSNSTNQAIQLYLDRVGHKAGNFTIDFKPYDDSTAAAGKWDEATCATNAAAHVANKNEVAVMGTYNSGCAKIEVPILEQDPSGPMLMVSHANTNVGLTQKFDKGEPEKYYPLGKRNYARVVTRDDIQGVADADFLAKDIGVKNCYVVNDNETYGQGVARTFIAQARINGINILGNDPWDFKQSTYTSLFTKIKAKNPDCVFIAGIFDNNGAQLVKDKVSVLGNNETVKLMGPDGFTQYPDLDKLPAAQGMYLSFAGLAIDALLKAGGAGGTFIDAYKAKYGKEPAAYAIYGVAAVQVILAAIAKSDGTRKSVTEQVLGGTSGITIPADVSVLGKSSIIDPATGDTNNKDISILLMKGNKETFLKGQTVGS